MIIADYSPTRNWCNLIGTTSTSESVEQILPQLPWKQKRGDLKKRFGFLSWNFVGISTVVCGSFWGCWKNSKWWPLPWYPRYKIPPLWAKFGFQVDYDVANWYSSMVCYGGHFESKMATKIKKSSDLGKIWFPSRFWCWELISMVWEPYYDPLCRNRIYTVVCGSSWGGGWKISKWRPLTW